MADGYLCRACSKVVGATKSNRYRTHKNAAGEACENSSLEIPQYLLQQAPSDTKSAGVPEEGKDFAKCPQCGRNVKLTRLGYFPPHQTTLYGGEQCQTTGVRAKHAGVPKDVPLPGDTVPEKGVNRALTPKVSNQMEVERERVGKPMKALPPGASSAASAPPEKEPSAPTAPPDEFPPTDEEAKEALRAFEEPVGSNLIQQPMALTEEILAQWSEVEVQASALRAASSGASTETNSPGSASTFSPSSPLPDGSDGPSPTSSNAGPFPLGPTFPGRIQQPVSLILQPPEWTGSEKPEPMKDLAKDLSTRIDELFYSYDNRKTKDNRSAQTTLGPSEIGTLCDRRLAMALMGVPPVNPGGDGWAAFVGTKGHDGMAEMLTWANAGTGRFAVEMKLTFPSLIVPHGTTDALDRMDGTLIDWKFMGEYSLKKFKLEGPSPTYRIQAQTYGLGAKEAGEAVRNVAIVGLPRGGGSLKDKHVWTEKFDPKVGRAALKRVENIAVKTAGFEQHGTPMEIAAKFETANDCRFCPFYLKGDKEMRRGCPGM